MAKRFNIHEWRRSIKESDREVINEDGGTYSVSIDVYDSGDRVHVDIKDSEDWEENKDFSNSKEAADYIIKYVSLWT